MKKVSRTMYVVEVTYEDQTKKYFTGMGARQIQELLGDKVKVAGKELKFECTEEEFLSVARVVEKNN